MKSKSNLGRLAILSAALIWGSSFIVMKDAIGAIPMFLLLAVRFTIAGALLSLIFLRRLRQMNGKMFLHGAFTGVLLFASYVAQTLGLADTTPGKNAFLTAIYCVIVPFLTWMLFRRRPTKWNWISGALCITGIGLVSLDGDLTMRMGDALTLVGGFCFSAHMVAVSYYGEREDPVTLTVCQFISSAVLCWIGTFIFEGASAAIPQDAWFELLYLSIFASAAAMLLQNVGQSLTSASSASILLSFESVFGVMFSVLLGRESLTLRVATGFSLIFLATIANETQFSFLKKKSRTIESGAQGNTK